MVQGSKTIKPILVFLKSLGYREVARNGQQLDLAGAVVHNQRQ